MLTLTQNKTYQFIQKYILEHGYSPTMAEIAEGIGITSRGVVHRYVNALVMNGLIELTPRRRRNIHLVDQSPTYFLPLVGKIAAGKPIEAIEDRETVDIMNIFLGPGRYALKVQGDSMIEEGILDGDVVVCEHRQIAEAGKIVVALIDSQEVTLKRIHYNPDDTITLFPANSNHQPMTYSKERVQIQGIYIGLIRCDH